MLFVVIIEKIHHTHAKTCRVCAHAKEFTIMIIITICYSTSQCKYTL